MSNNIFFEGTIEGDIIRERRGVKGFGYDPIFIPKGYTQTFAEMSAEEKKMQSVIVRLQSESLPIS